jgi:hypothetical protein
MPVLAGRHAPLRWVLLLSGRPAGAEGPKLRLETAFTICHVPSAFPLFSLYKQGKKADIARRFLIA